MPVLRAPRKWTEAEFDAARDAAPAGERWELVDGEVLVTPSPNWVHQRVIGSLHALIDAYLRTEPVGTAFVSPLDVKLEKGLVLQPDLLVVPAGQLRTRHDVVRELLLAVEIVSPSSAKHDRVTKRPRYQRNRVPEYWVIDDYSQTVERWRPEDSRPELISDVLTWHPAGAQEPLTLQLSGFFGEILPA